MSCRDRVETLSAPARINILGEHVDYVSYIPTASLTFGSKEHRMTMRLRPREDREVQGESVHLSRAPFRFEIGAFHSDRPWNEYLSAVPAAAPDWSNYVRGAVEYALWKYGSAIQIGFEFFLDSNIPSDGGASSSSALTVLAGAAIRKVNGIQIDREELARDSARAEWFAGTRGGEMDHLTICLAETGHAVHLDYGKPSWRTVSIPVEPVRWVTAFSHSANKGAEVMLEYNERAAVSRILIPALLETLPSIEELPESIDLAAFGKTHPAEMETCRELFPLLVRERSQQQLRIRDLSRHHRDESDRVRRAIHLFESETSGAEALWSSVGNLLDQSHESLAVRYSVSTLEVEQLRDSMRSLRGVYGARLMGGGFGGNVLALVATEAVDEFVRRLNSDYYKPRGRDCVAEGSIMVSTPGPGIMLSTTEIE